MGHTVPLYIRPAEPVIREVVFHEGGLSKGVPLNTLLVLTYTELFPLYCAVKLDYVLMSELPHDGGLLEELLLVHLHSTFIQPLRCDHYRTLSGCCPLCLVHTAKVAIAKKIK